MAALGCLPFGVNRWAWCCIDLGWKPWHGPPVMVSSFNITLLCWGGLCCGSSKAATMGPSLGWKSMSCLWHFRQHQWMSHLMPSFLHWRHRLEMCEFAMMLMGCRWCLHWRRCCFKSFVLVCVLTVCILSVPCHHVVAESCYDILIILPFQKKHRPIKRSIKIIVKLKQTPYCVY